MRSEYVAQLGPIQEFAPEIDQSRFHLKLLSKAGALEAIQRPALMYGYRYAQACYERIIADLKKEDRYVEPAHLSLICEKLWDEKGRHMAEETSAATGSDTPEIDLATYEERLSGARGILRAFLRDYLAELPDDHDRTESLELLDPLITGSGTRNIVERKQLIDVPFRDSERRHRLLQGLVARTIVRVEVRLGGSFVEITHEFLIPSIQEAMQDFLVTSTEYQRLRAALQTLRGLSGTALGTDFESILSRNVLITLHEQQERVVWNSFTTELMLRACIFYGQRDAVATWSQKYAATADDANVVAALERVGRGDMTRDLLSAQELRVLNESRDEATLTSAQTMFVLRSQIERGAPGNNDDIRYWARRVVA